VKVTVKSQKDKESVEKLNIKDILIAIKTKEPKKAIKEIIAARRLLSEDILLLTLTKKVIIIFKKSNEWLRAVTLTAEILRITFLIFIHGVRVKGVNINE
jgi:hypothetical protein